MMDFRDWTEEQLDRYIWEDICPDTQGLIKQKSKVQDLNKLGRRLLDAILVVMLVVIFAVLCQKIQSVLTFNVDAVSSTPVIHNSLYDDEKGAIMITVYDETEF